MIILKLKSRALRLKWHGNDWNYLEAPEGPTCSDSADSDPKTSYPVASFETKQPPSIIAKHLNWTAQKSSSAHHFRTPSVARRVGILLLLRRRVSPPGHCHRFCRVLAPIVVRAALIRSLSQTAPGASTAPHAPGPSDRHSFVFSANRLIDHS